MKNVTPNEAQKIIENGEVVVIDVRTHAEFSDGHIKGAKNIDIYDEEFYERIKTLDHNANYVINCRSGGRSSRAASFMNEEGFKNVMNLEGGITAWKEAGLSMEK